MGKKFTLNPHEHDLLNNELNFILQKAKVDWNSNKIGSTTPYINKLQFRKWQKQFIAGWNEEINHHIDRPVAKLHTSTDKKSALFIAIASLIGSIIGAAVGIALMFAVFPPTNGGNPIGPIGGGEGGGGGGGGETPAPTPKDGPSLLTLGIAGGVAGGIGGAAGLAAGIYNYMKGIPAYTYKNDGRNAAHDALNKLFPDRMTLTRLGTIDKSVVLPVLGYESPKKQPAPQLIDNNLTTAYNTDTIEKPTTAEKLPPVIETAEKNNISPTTNPIVEKKENNTSFTERYKETKRPPHEPGKKPDRSISLE